jgi:hypothetical protein
VTKVFKGEPSATESVAVKQLCGKLNGIPHEVDGQTPLKPSNTYVLFLATYPDAPASLLNPTQAQYPVDKAGQSSSLPGNAISFTMSDLIRLADGK